MLAQDQFITYAEERYGTVQEVAPTLVIEFEDYPFDLERRLTGFYRSRGVPREYFFFKDGYFCVFSPHHYTRLKSILPVDHKVVLKAEFPNRDAYMIMRPVKVYSRPHGCTFDYTAFIRECALFRSKYDPTKPLVVIDFEAFSTARPVTISEVGIAKVVGGNVTYFHSFIEFHGQYDPDEAAVANIPYDKMPGHSYCTLAYIAKQIGENALICAKGPNLERIVLRYMLHIRQEVFEVQCVSALFGAFDAQPKPGKRCYYHYTASGHCALEDATEWAFLLAELTR